MTSDVRHRHGRSGRTGGDRRADLGGAAMLEAAAALRWRSPRLTADLAHRVVEDAAAAGDGPLWLRSAGWYLHGRAATGDAREAAVEILTSAGSFAGGVGIDDAGGARLRVEVAAIAQSNGDVDQARALLRRHRGEVTRGDQDELELDRVAVLVRCALAEPGRDLEELRRSAEGIGRRFRAEPAAFVDLLVGSIHRSRADQRAAAASALRGLANLGWAPEAPDALPASPHLAAALFRQWITALLDGGSDREVASAVRAVRDQPEQADTGRQGVLLRLTLARAVPDTAERTASALHEVAEHAARIGTPSIEAACRATQAEVHEGVGEYRQALVALRAGTAAERMDRDRAGRFRDALAAVVVPRADTRTGGLGAVSTGSGGDPLTGVVPDVADLASAVHTDALGAGRARAMAAGPAATPGIEPAELTAHRRGGTPAAVRVDRAGPGDGRRPGGPAGGARHAEPGHRGGSGAVDGQATVAESAASATGTTGVPATHRSDAAEQAGGYLLEWADRSWYGPGRAPRAGGGAPLADALVEELRAGVARRPVSGAGQPRDKPVEEEIRPFGAGAGHDPLSDGAGHGLRSDGAGQGLRSDGAGQGLRSDGAGQGLRSDGAGQGSRSEGSGRDRGSEGAASGEDVGDGGGGEVVGEPAPTTTRREPWATLLPGAQVLEPETDPRRAIGVAAPLADPAGGAGERSPERQAGRADGDDDGGQLATARPAPATAAETGPGRAASSHSRIRDLDAPDGDAGPSAAPTADVGGHLVVLDLVHGDHPVRHPAGAVVLNDAAERAARMVPSGGEIRTRHADPGVDVLGGAAEDGTDPGRIEIALPDADRVTAMLWAQSLVGHLAARVGRNGLPLETALRSQVHDTAGPVGVGVVQDLTGPDRPGDGVGSSPTDGSDAPDAPPVREASSGRHGGPAVWAVDGVVQPGSGGRRRRDAPGAGTVEPVGSTVLPEPAAAEITHAAPPEAGAEEEKSARVARLAARRRSRRAQGDECPSGGPAETGAATTGSGTGHGHGNGRRDGGGGPDGDRPRTVDPTDIPDDLGLAELLAGALAAYRDI